MEARWLERQPRASAHSPRATTDILPVVAAAADKPCELAGAGDRHVEGAGVRPARGRRGRASLRRSCSRRSGSAHVDPPVTPLLDGALRAVSPRSGRAHARSRASPPTGSARPGSPSGRCRLAQGAREVLAAAPARGDLAGLCRLIRRRPAPSRTDLTCAGMPVATSISKSAGTANVGQRRRECGAMPPAAAALAATATVT